MSAFCGVVASSHAAASTGVLSSMSSRLRHRGPDLMNVYEDPHAGISLAHLHLNAFGVDSSTPGFLQADDVVVAVDGCVTNSRKLSPELRSLGTQSSSRDAAVIASVYRADAHTFLDRLNGPFSMALWDTRERQLFLSRDRIGEGAVYYYYDPAQHVFLFASEIKAILAHPAVRPALDLDALSLYLMFGYIPGPRTLFRGICKLLPGQVLKVATSGPPDTHKYWRLPPITDGSDDERWWIRTLRDRFMEGLEGYVSGAREVAVFLSGGIDSTVIVAGLRELGVPRIATFTIGFATRGARSQDREDLVYGRLVAARLGTEHHEVVVDAGHELRADLLRVINHADDLVMTPNGYSKYLLAQAVRKAGFNSVLTGSAAAGECGVHRQFLDPDKRAKLLMKTAGCTSNDERYARLRGRLFNVEDQRRLLRQSPAIDRDALDALRNYIADIQSEDFFRFFLFSGLMITSSEKSLKALGQATALASVSVRSPYLDRALVESATKLPASFDGKTYVTLKTHVKKAFEHVLPEEVLRRPVIGYPAYYWHKGELQECQARVLSRDAIEENGIFNYDAVVRLIEEDTHSDAKSVGKTAWALTQFCLWHEVHIKQNAEFRLAGAA